MALQFVVPLSKITIANACYYKVTRIKKQTDNVERWNNSRNYQSAYKVKLEIRKLNHLSMQQRSKIKHALKLYYIFKTVA